jgi:hypothetical protein
MPPQQMRPAAASQNPETDNESSQMDGEEAPTTMREAYPSAYTSLMDRFGQEPEANQGPFPIVRPDHMDQLLPSSNLPGWSEEDEAQLQQEWENDELRLFILGRNTNNRKPLRKLWKISLQYLRCAPTVVLGIGNKFEVDQKQLAGWAVPAVSVLAAQLVQGV